jgi:membrane-associated phospholipid phosphatase
VAFALSLTRAMLTAHFLADVMGGAAVGIIATRETFLLVFPHLSPSWI